MVETHTKGAGKARDRPAGPSTADGTTTASLLHQQAQEQRAPEPSQPRDHRTLAPALAMQASVLCLGKLTAQEHRIMGALLAVTLTALVAKLCAPRFWRSLRTPVLAALRTLLILIPLILNTQRIMQPSADDGGGAGALSLVGVLRSLFVLLLPLAWVDGLAVMAVGFPLPPLVHLVAQMLGVGLLMHRVPAGCSQYVSQSSTNATLARSIYWVLRHLASLVCLGSREHLAAAAAASSDTQQCSAVVWALEVALGLVLPTLLVWSTQLDRARQHAAQQEQQHGRHAPLPAQHRLLCEPLVNLAGTFSWPVVISLSALAAFLAAVVWQHS